MLGVSSDARLLASRNDMSSAPPEAILGTPHLGWLSPNGFDTLPYNDTESEGRQITSAHLDGDTVTWVETSSIDLYNFDWRIYSAVLGTDGRTLVADSDDFSKGRMLNPVFGTTQPVVLGGTAYWAATDVGGKSDDSLIWAGSVAPGGKPAKPIVDDGYLPTSDGSSYLYYVKRIANGTTSIVRERSGAGKPTAVVMLEKFDGSVTRLAASDRHLAWVESYKDGTSRLFVKELASGEVTAIRMEHPGPSTMFLSLSQDKVVWGSGSAEGDAGQYLYNFSSGALTRLADSPGLSLVYAADSAIAWSRLKPNPGGPPTASWVVGESTK
ncbi:MAG: hypothetical protein ACRCYU_07100 [Nocardioides sp.]